MEARCRLVAGFLCSNPPKQPSPSSIFFLFFNINPSGSFLNRRFYIHLVSFSSFFLIYIKLQPPRIKANTRKPLPEHPHLLCSASYASFCKYCTNPKNHLPCIDKSPGVFNFETLANSAMRAHTGKLQFRTSRSLTPMLYGTAARSCITCRY